MVEVKSLTLGTSLFVTDERKPAGPGTRLEKL